MNIASIIIGRKGSKGFPGKNNHLVNGKPMAYYPMNAAKSSSLIGNHFISTDDENLMSLASELGFNIIKRPKYLATSEALGEDVFKHAYEEIVNSFSINPDLLVLLFCNAPTVNTDMINNGIRQMISSPVADSAVSVSKYNMYSPSRARKINSTGYLDPFVPFESFPNIENISCDRDSQGDVYYADMGVSIIRPKNLLSMDSNLPPQKWMGNKILPIYNEYGLDIDYSWQLGQVIDWVDKNY